MEIFGGIVEDAILLDAFDGEDVVGKIVDLEGLLSESGIAKLAQAELREANGFGGPPEDGNIGLRLGAAELNAGGEVSIIGIDGVDLSTGLAVDFARSDFGFELDGGGTPRRVLEDVEDVGEIPFDGRLVPGRAAERGGDGETSDQQGARKHGWTGQTPGVRMRRKRGRVAFWVGGGGLRVNGVGCEGLGWVVAGRREEVKE